MQTTVTYKGPAPMVGALAQALRQQGVKVSYRHPREKRDAAAAEIIVGVVINLACTGGYDAIKAGVSRFRASRLGKSSEVTIAEPPKSRDKH